MVQIDTCNDPVCQVCEEGEYQDHYNHMPQCKRQPSCDKSTQMSDTVCEPCPNGTFSIQESAEICNPWTECSPGFIEVTPGSSTSDRICGASKKFPIITPVIVVVLLLVVVGGFGYLYYRKGNADNMCVGCLQVCIKSAHPIAQDAAYVENGPKQQQEPRNQPQEDNEDLVKQETSLLPGISENGMPVIQDHSKSFLLSETETEPESVSVYF
ncbi:Tumor necrosis factor receptor superfamily member 5 [Bagarius yarrelli]|uniref:Tumor necrosis factor receptor superfamily member 5 n=1 Tax=Bagarius yarrelli TaxID=175774 RepID=A0A556U0J6_BAGYA|nr:Tumor necrosis factor receptor superfamily member 5 [Bagarius yarrelli]